MLNNILQDYKESQSLTFTFSIFCDQLPFHLSAQNPYKFTNESMSQQFLDFVDSKQITSLISHLCVGLSVFSLTSVIYLFIVCRRNVCSNTEAIRQSFQESIQNNIQCYLILLSVVMNIIFISTLQSENFYEDIAQYVKETFILTITFVILCTFTRKYDKVELAQSQNEETSIGAYYAIAAFEAYYKLILEKHLERIQNFEKEHPEMKFFIKKLILIAPLSCNIEGKFCDKDLRFTHIGDLEHIPYDQGANINRCYKTPVYEIDKNKGLFIASELTSPLGTLWGVKDVMDKKLWLYIRDTFLKELKDCLKHYPVIILEYDDQEPTKTEPLSDFVESSLKKYRKENNHRVKVLFGDEF